MEERVTCSGNVATVCAINSKNSMAVERAHYEHSTDRAGPFKLKQCTVARLWFGKKTGTFFDHYWVRLFLCRLLPLHYREELCQDLWAWAEVNLLIPVLAEQRSVT